MTTPAITAHAPVHHDAARRAGEQALYDRYRDRLLRSVRAAVRAPDETIEDACAFAWLQLVATRPEHGPRVFAWLRAVAVHEAIRLARLDRRYEGCDAEWAVDPRLPDVETLVEAREAGRALRSLRDRQRRILVLFLAGYSYEEIAERTGDTVRTVERQLLRGRARLRRDV
jgi:RNA polymerase sigma factor (sigma-70 family)